MVKFFEKLQKRLSVENTSAHSKRQMKKDAMTSRCLDRKEVHAPPSKCTLCDRYYIHVFFWHLVGPVALTGKAIEHWIGCINAIKVLFPLRALLYLINFTAS